MRKLLIVIFFIVSCGSGGGSGKNSAPPPEPVSHHIEYMGYYWGMSQSYGNFVDDFKDYTNMVNIHITGDWDYDIAMVEEAIANGLAPLIYLDPRAVWLDRFWHRNVTINYDFWNEFVKRLYPYINDLAGFYVFDEPFIYSHRISLDTQQWIISYYNQAFPGVRSWATFARRDKGVPNNLDIVSATPYNGHVPATTYKVFLSELKKFMHPGQKFAVTIDGFCGYPQISKEDEQKKADTAWDYYQLALANPDVMALYIFLYPSFDNDVLGVEDMPIVENELKLIWSKLNNGG